MQLVNRRPWLAAQLIVATALAAPVHAQSSASGTLAIAAQVVAPLSLTVTHSLDFGRILVATTKTITPGAAASGHFELAGQGGGAVTVTLSMPATLTPSAGTPLPITSWTYVMSDTPALSGTTVAFNSGTSDPIAARFQTGAGTTKLYFGIGATIQPSAAQSTTTYTATGQITAAYSDL